MIKLNGLPLNRDPIVPEEGTFTKVWLQSIGDIGDSLKGNWGMVPTDDIVESGISYDSVSYSLIQQGLVLTVNIVFTGLTSTNGTLDLSTLRYAPNPSVLTVHSGNNWDISSGIYIDSAVINLPDTTSTNLAITGTLIRNQ